jgi:peptidoglycan/LPS O-acetylase OafA/YrhL
MVLISHASISRDAIARPFWPLLMLASNGELGVDLFFVISGYLITGLLLNEMSRTGGISLGDFYLRRAFRILPACYTFLGTLVILNALGVISISLKGLLGAMFFVRNYMVSVNGADWATAQCWSLSVEEQFYLLWPLALILLSRRQATWLAVGLIAAAPLSRVITYFSLPGLRWEIIYMTHTRVDTLMFGCLAALLSGSGAFQCSVHRAFALRLPLLATVWVWVVSPLLRFVFEGYYMLTVGYTLEGIGIVLVVIWVVEHPESLAGQLLNSRPLMHLGILSYSMYLWQQWLMRYPIPGSLVAVLIAAECSYFLVERPFLRLRQRLLRPEREPHRFTGQLMPSLRTVGVRMDESPV